MSNFLKSNPNYSKPLQWGTTVLLTGMLSLAACSDSKASKEVDPSPDSTTPVTTELALPDPCPPVTFEAGESPYSKAQEMAGWDAAQGDPSAAQRQLIVSYADQMTRALDREDISSPTEIPEGTTIDVCFAIGD